MNIDRVKLVSKMFEKYGHILKLEDCEDLADDIIDVTNSSNEFYAPLLEWLSGSHTFSDVIINDFPLDELAFKLDNVNPNIPVAILILWMSGQDNVFFHGLPAIASIPCIANPEIILGSQCKYAIFSGNKWFFMLDDQGSNNLKEYQTWQVLLLNPNLIPQVAYEHENNTALILQDDGSYLISHVDEEV